MSLLSHSLKRLSICSAVTVLAVTAITGAQGAPTPPSPFFGRWTVSEDRPAFTVRGQQYKTIDIAPCGKDFCGISIARNSSCGPALFRFLMKHADGQSQLVGHGKWGNQIKNIQIESYRSDGNSGKPLIELYLGDGHDFGGRSDSMPRFHAEYKRIGAPQCKAR